MATTRAAEGVAMKTKDFNRLPTIDKSGGCVNVVVETPKSSRGKFKYDSELGAFELHKILPLGFAFPYDFGFIPSTRGEDGDPIDVLLLLDVPVPTGTVVRSRLLGIIEAEQTEKDGKTVRNDRLLAKAVNTNEDDPIVDISELPESTMNEIETFFADYNREQGKKFKPLRRRGAKVAMRILKRAAN
jgi:inorganic pyrophosphatase